MKKTILADYKNSLNEYSLEMLKNIIGSKTFRKSKNNDVLSMEDTVNGIMKAIQEKVPGKKSFFKHFQQFTKYSFEEMLVLSWKGNGKMSFQKRAAYTYVMANLYALAQPCESFPGISAHELGAYESE